MASCSAWTLAAGRIATPRQLLDEAGAMFKILGTLDEPVRIEAAREALDRGSPVNLLMSRL